MSLIERTHHQGVTTLRMNHPKKLNGWTQSMMDALRDGMAAADADPATKVLVLTGTDPYYSAGVNLAGTLGLAHPRELHAQIIEHNQALFEQFLGFSKPLIAAVNGPAIGAVVTSATLCDAIVASERATFSTPFARLGVTPEGCSSVLFEKLMSARNAQRMLGPEGWVPDAREAKEAGLIDQVVPHDELASAAQTLGERWITAGRKRVFKGGMSVDALRAINARESRELADAFLDVPFLMGQYRFLRKKGKRRMAVLFWTLARTRPLWSRMLDQA